MASNVSSDFRKCRISDSESSNANFYPLRMTTEHRTEMYVKFAKVMLIFQGPMTEKRRTAVAELASKFKYAGCVISDETYKKETSRWFSEEKTEDFYRYFRNRVKKSCEEGYNLIIIDQSMNNPLQMRYYFYLAQAMQYLIIPYPPVFSLENLPYKAEDKEGSGRKKTQADTFAYTRFENNLFKHLFCGWFLHDVDSIELREEASLYVQDCFDNIPEFHELFSKICNPSEFRSCYNMLDKRQNLAFCPVKILENILEIRRYMSSPTFAKFYGNMSKLYVVGFVISPHIVAARIRLTYEQKKLWEMRDDADENHQVSGFPSKLLESSKVDPFKESITLIASKCNRTIISGESISEPTEAINARAKGRSCHIVLGKVMAAPAKNVDYDVAFAIHREKNVLQQHAHDVRPYDLDRCLVRRIGKYWYIYLKESLIVNGLFASCCSIDN